MVCVYVYVCMYCMYVCMYVCMYAYLVLFIHIRSLFDLTYICKYKQYVCTYVCKYMLSSLYNMPMHVCMYVYMLCTFILLSAQVRPVGIPGVFFPLDTCGRILHRRGMTLKVRLFH